MFDNRNKPHGEMPEPAFKNTNTKEKKYFISYAAYLKDYSQFDIFNDFIYIEGKITGEIIMELQDMLIKKLNKDTENKPYKTAQIISFFEI